MFALLSRKRDIFLQAKMAADFEQMVSWARHGRYADVETAMNQVHLFPSEGQFFKDSPLSE